MNSAVVGAEETVCFAVFLNFFWTFVVFEEMDKPQEQRQVCSEQQCSVSL